ncbi:MAG: putative peptide zinc metalloprotease protein [Actinomycetota bacterium]|nr:putative peptide zinc metalloprotease protein [Actinomycetota bacterium]
MSITSPPPEAGPRTSGDGDVAQPGAPASAPGAAVPVRAEGLELIGELPGSGYRTPPSLVRRADGQTIQLTRLLYLVLAAVDGQRDLEGIASRVSETSGRGVSAEQVASLLESKLAPLGLLRLADGSQPTVAKSNPLLALKLRFVVSDPEKTRRLTAPFAALFHPLIVTVLVLAFLASAGWVLFRKGLAGATHQAFDQPGLLLALFAVTLVSAGFHELGHAAACRHRGATPGAMGAGLYLVWPAFYTDVTDSYRLGRGGRVTVDLGGLYFNAIFAVGTFGVWAVTRRDAVLLLIAAQVLQMLRQLAPFIRFDGYHILADVTGVPDLYHHIKPTLRAALPQNWKKNEGLALKPWARVVVTVWVVVVVPLLLFSLLLMVVAMPRVMATGWAALGKQWGLLETYWSAGELAKVGIKALSIVAIALPLAASIYLVVRIVRRTSASTWRKTQGKPVRRTVAGVLAVALIAGLAFAWWPRADTYRPVQAFDRGTVLDGLPIVQNSRALGEGQVSATRTMLAQGASLGTKQQPQLALVLVPRKGSGAPTWVFPFNQPPPAGPGGNQALAVNTRDGATVYDVAFALVWADGDTVLNRNEAYAFASCKRCKTVAVGFQVVLIVGQANVIVPQNLSAAANYGCLACVTQALAKQLVISIPESGLSPDANARLAALWKQIRTFGAAIKARKLSLTQVRARLAVYEQQISAIVRGAATSATVGSTATSPTSLPSATDPATAGTEAPATAGDPASPSATDPAAPVDSPAAVDSPAPSVTDTTAPASPAASPTDPAPLAPAG